MPKIKSPLENRDGVLHIGGCSTVELADAYDTPLYVYDENRIRKNYRNLYNAFSKDYEKFHVHYAIKANNNLAIVKILKSEGAGIDVSGSSEIELAKIVGFKDDEILYTGAYQRQRELLYALDNNVRINLDDLNQIDRLFKYGQPKFLSFRINPGVGAGKFEGLVFAGPEAKFGLDKNDVIKAYKKAKDYGVENFGIHMMTGSCVLDPNYFVEITERLMDIAGDVSKKLGVKFEMVDIGGGFGVPYRADEKELDIKRVGKDVCNVFKKKIKQYKLGEPYLVVEPGRYLVCDSSILLTRVHSVKDGQKKFVGVDAGMNTLLRPMLYNAYHEILLANDLDAEPTQKVNIVGPICENTDQLAKDRMMPDIKPDDLLAVLNVGTYGFGMGSQYNTRPRAEEVLVNKGKHTPIRRREITQDLISTVIIPDYLM